MKCPYCQREINDKTRLCPQCRKEIPPCAELSTADGQEPEQKSRGNQEVGIGTCVIVCALFFGGCGGLWVGLVGAVIGLIIGLLFCRKGKNIPEDSANEPSDAARPKEESSFKKILLWLLFIIIVSPLIIPPVISSILFLIDNVNQ